MTLYRFPPVVLCILDGWGENRSEFGNAIKAAKTPNFDYLDSKFPPILINASGEYVGLPDGQMGNSEVGHLNIGAGRVILQELPKINQAINDGSFYTNRVIDAGMKKALEKGTDYHLLGLVSDGGVHSHLNHLEAFLKKAKKVGLKEVFIHALMDGRDTSPHGGIDYMKQLVKMTETIGIGKLATISGRYYTMDRDNRWERVEKGYNAMVHGTGIKAADPVEAIDASYGNGITDEFIEPIVLTDKNGEPLGRMVSGSVLQVFNFRADRVRQIIHALTDERFDSFDRGDAPDLELYCMTQYDETFGFPVAFEGKPPENGLGSILSANNISQLRAAETEKYAHVTFFFNGGIEEPYANETRKLVPSPKVATYDLKPEMSAYEVTQHVVATINYGRAEIIVVNLANGDMVGHTGMFPAAMKAVSTVDECVGRIMEAIRAVNGYLIITADHGNIEAMIDEHDNPITAHSTNQVPFYLYGNERLSLNGGGGSLCDVAPTLLSIIKLPKPDEMTGCSLIAP